MFDKTFDQLDKEKNWAELEAGKRINIKKLEITKKIIEEQLEFLLSKSSTPEL